MSDTENAYRGVEYGKPMREHFLLNPSVVFINNGSRGAPTKTVYKRRLQLLDEQEDDPERWFRFKMDDFWEKSVLAASKFLGSNPDNLVLVTNTTVGLNSVMKSLPLKPEEAILLYTWQYEAIANTCEMASKKSGCSIICVTVPLPITSPDQIVSLYKEALIQHPNIKVAVLEHICSPTGVQMPLMDLVTECKKHDVTVVVDGAHAPGQLELNLEQMGENGVDCFIGNLHKWAFAPRGCAVLWIHPRLHDVIRPAITSRPHDDPRPANNFKRQGTEDASTLYTADVAIDEYRRLGGLDKVTSYCRHLLDEAVVLLTTSWCTQSLPVPDSMTPPCMRMVQLPVINKFPPDKGIDKEVFGDYWSLQRCLRDQYNIDTLCMYVHGKPYVRLSAHIYNHIDDYQNLADAVLHLQHQ